ncbi:MAG TPA: sigma-70 family RNA polymerase sigma factor [Candidatus Solibacter sp.]|nr:sigma-70 family RNA polymerase sigma factor [Candidatus Solibacter sp.]
MNQSPRHAVWQLYGEGERIPARTQDRMQELVLIQPRSIVSRSAVAQDGETNLTREAAEAALRREFEERLAECGPLAYRVARSVLRNDADAQDVAQEALLRAYRRFAHLRERARFRGWLVRIAFRLAIDRTRSSKRREARETLWSQTAPRPSTEDLAATSEFQAHLDRAMEELPEKHRLVILLAAMQGHSLEEVAESLGLPMGTVKSRLFFARKQLAEKLRCHVKTIEKR